jgi:outer membrane protein assembly factor BamB
MKACSPLAGDRGTGMGAAARLAAACVAILIASLISLGVRPGAAQAQVTDSWTTSLHDNSRTGASSDTNISASQAPDLTKLWSLATGGPIASQPAIVGGVAYVGSWDGYEYALNASTGAVIWKTFLGTTTGESDCNPQNAGVSSAATVLNGVVYVGGGNAYWYALDASTGSVLWDVYTGDNSAAGGHYNWSSPLIVNGYAYIGVASLGDCPLIQGQLLQVSLSTHQIVNTLDLVPDGSVGGGIWTSPAYDPNLNEIFTVTGTETSDAETYAQAVVGINASSLAVVDYWHLPESQAVADSDWTTSTGLYTGANGTPMLETTNKNGYTYAFNRTDLAAGPVWQDQIAIGNDCAACGYSTVSSAAIAQGMVFQAGGATTINGVGYGGSVQALNATTGAVVWQHPEAGPVIGAITYMNGMVIAGAGSGLELLDATTGQRLYSYDTGPGNWIYAAPAVANGVIITGNTAGVIYGFGLPATLPGPPPPDPNCPTSFTCQDIGSPAPAGSESVTSGTWAVSAGGAGVSAASDSFRLMSEPSSGDVQIDGRVTGQTGGSATGAEAGLMLRQSNDPGSPYYGIFVTPQGITVQYRYTFDGGTTIANTITLGGLPVYLQIQRQGDVLQAATSPDGVTYTTIPGSTATVLMPYASLAGLAVSSGESGTSGTATFDHVSVGAVTNTPQDTPSASGCPAGWSCGDVGDPIVVGSQSLSGNDWTFEGAGASISDVGLGTGIGAGGMTDQFHYVWTTTTGDTSLSTHITAQGNTNAGATAGVMMRADTSANAAYYGAFVTPGNGVEVMERTAKGGPAVTLETVNGTPPVYLRITRSGDVFTTYTSSDGATWTPVTGGTDTIPSLNGTILDGEAVTSGVADETSTVTADVLDVTDSSPAPPTACPTSWTCANVDSAIPPGSNYLVNGVWSILGGGKDIYGTVDEFQYTAESMPGNGTVSAEITSQQDTDPWAKAGIMLRASTDPSAPYYAILATPGNGTVVQYRTSEGDSTTQLTGVTNGAPIYVEVMRTGDSYTAYTSTDGVNWTAYPDSTVTIPDLSGSILGGMADTSHSQFVTSTAVFNNFTFTSGTSSLPVPWSDSDVGNPTLAGSASYANGVFTVNGAGGDIWGTLDQENYVSQSLTGDGSIVARVTSQSDTDPWAKSGVMIKQSTASGSAYALLAVTPGNGINFEYGYNTNVSGGSYTFPNAWLELTRSGSTITAYSSPDGVNWTMVGTTTISMTDPVTIGLFVCSHSPGNVSTSTFDNVSVTTS